MSLEKGHNVQHSALGGGVGWGGGVSEAWGLFEGGWLNRGSKKKLKTCRGFVQPTPRSFGLKCLPLDHLLNVFSQLFLDNEHIF